MGILTAMNRTSLLCNILVSSVVKSSEYVATSSLTVYDKAGSLIASRVHNGPCFPFSKAVHSCRKVLWSIPVELTQTNDEAGYRRGLKQGCGWMTGSKLQCDVGYMPTQKKKGMGNYCCLLIFLKLERTGPIHWNS